MHKRIKKILIPLLIGIVFLCGCAAKEPTPAGDFQQLEAYQETYFSLFDTVTIVKGYAVDEKAFHEALKPFYEEFLLCHELFDIYEEYPNLLNVKTINDNAGIAPVEVDERIISLLTFCKDVYDMTGGAVDVTLGPVLSIWHNAREAGENNPEDAYLPDMEELKAAKQHCGIDKLVIDESASTVMLTDVNARLDVGAIAKGYAIQMASKKLPEGYLISVGGNVVATGGKEGGDTPWVIGIRNPNGAADDYVEKVTLVNGSVVTSGDYQRFYTVDGVNYHHIIDPSTLMPGSRWRSVTILCEDSGLADALSTAVFLMDRESGEKIVLAEGAEAMWVDQDGNVYYTEGFKERLKK
ncbi:MAG: FAD:protein FMN transferase [Firmicutes bacterium]|nr:FAD:protein FMN transferase [Bacillota bacterium]